MSCTSCDGWGKIAPSPFEGDLEPWPAYLERAAALAWASRFPPRSSAALAGLVTPVACPSCGGARTRAGVMPFAQPFDADHRACGLEQAVGFVVIRPAPIEVEPQIAAEDLEPTAEWCLGYVSRHTGGACFQTRTGVQDGILRSTCWPMEIHRWASKAEALAWMACKGLAEGKAIPVGDNWLLATPQPFDPDWLRERPEWFDQVLFDVPRRKAAEAATEKLSDDALAEAVLPRHGEQTHARNAPKQSKRQLAERVAARSLFDAAE